MGVTVIWDDEKQTTQRYIYEGLWTWDEAHEALVEGQQQLDSVDYPVDSIVDMSDTKFIPSGAMVHLKRIFALGGAHPNFSGLTVFYKAEGYVKAMHQMVAEVYPDAAKNIEFLFASSLEEARDILKAMRPSR
jgi:hypothetical protein